MDRDRFLKLLQKFDDNYFVDEHLKEYFLDKAKEENKTIKEYMMSSPNPTLQVYSQIDYEYIRGISSIISENILDIRDKNPFSDFYYLEEEKLNLFFNVLHTVNLFIKYFEDYEFDRLRTADSRVALQNKYIDVIEDIKILGLLKNNEIETLRERIKSLQKQPTITKRKIFEHLLYGIALVFSNENKTTFSVTKKIADITNSLIANYYDSDEKFTRHTNINNFIKHTYTIETAKPITLVHSTGGIA